MRTHGRFHSIALHLVDFAQLPEHIQQQVEAAKASAVPGAIRISLLYGPAHLYRYIDADNDFTEEHWKVAVLCVRAPASRAPIALTAESDLRDGDTSETVSAEWRDAVEHIIRGTIDSLPGDEDHG